MSTRHTLSVLVENKPGVLTRVSALFARRAFNIHSLAVGETEDPNLSRITVVVDGAELDCLDGGGCPSPMRAQPQYAGDEIGGGDRDRRERARQCRCALRPRSLLQRQRGQCEHRQRDR